MFGAVPIARGRGDVESLTGFFARLCVSRFVMPARIVRAFVLDRCPPGLFPSHPHAIGNFLTKLSVRFDLQPDCALAFAAALEDLTGLSDLHALTFSACAPSLGSPSLRYVGRHRKVWCAGCFAAWEADGAPLYEPILWRFALVERCPVHRLALLDRCPVCERRQPLVTQGVPIGYCVRCGHALHHAATLYAPAEALLDVSERWALWRSVTLWRLLAWSSSVDCDALARLRGSSSAFSRLLKHAFECPADPSIRSSHAMACALGLDDSQFGQLLGGAIRPSLLALLDICMQLGVDPLRVVRGDFSEGERSWPPSRGFDLAPCADPWRFALEARESRMARRHPARVQALDDFIDDPHAVDLAALMRAHRVGPTWLSTAFPLRHNRARELRVVRLARKRELTSQRCDAVLESEIAAGAPRSLLEIAASLGIRPDILRRFSPERSAQLVASRESSFSTRGLDLPERIRSALHAALDLPEGPTLSAVARSFGVQRWFVSKLYPEDSRALVALRACERKARHARYAAAMREDLARPRPRGITFVADQLGVCRPTLRRADPALYARFTALPRDRVSAARRRRESAARTRADALRVRRSHLAEALDRELRSDAPRSLGAVALECCVAPSVLRHHCPDQCRSLRGLRAAARSEFLGIVRSALEAEISLPAPRSLSALAADLGTSTYTLGSSFPSLVAELRDALDRASNRPRRRHFHPDHSRILAALEAEVRSSSPRSVAALSRALKILPSTLSLVSPEAVKRLHAVRAEQRRRHDARLKALIVPVLEAELRSEQPRSGGAVARQLSLSRTDIARLAPALYRRLIDRHRRPR